MKKLKRKKQIRKSSKAKITKRPKKIVKRTKIAERPKAVGKKKRKNKGNLIKKSVIKIVVLALIVGLNWVGFSAVVGTLAYFNDNETSSENSFSASTLDFSLGLPLDFSPVIMPNATATRNISLTNDGILGFGYKAEATSTVGVLCDHLNLEAKLNGTATYNGALTGFNYNVGGFATTTRDWQFTANLTSNDPALQNQTCNFDFVFDGVQAEGPGFSDQEIISNTITSGIWLKILINKVYYDVDDAHGGDTDEWKHEWIELYNPLSNDVNLKNWEICDNTDCKTIHPDVSIPALGYALLSHDASTWQQYWEVPAGVEKINLGGAPSHLALDNTADMLVLKNADGVVIDQMNWGAPDSSWPNYNLDVWNPGAPDVAAGHMLGRVPSGYDTDQPSDFKDLALPTVSVIWPNGGETLWVGRTHDLKWTATNPNGDNNALSIDILYSKDSGATWAKIATSTENDGIFSWRVPLFINGYYVPSSRARIKVMARGPENFMVQNWDMSDTDFCPPIDYSLLTEEELAYLKEMGMLETTVSSAGGEAAITPGEAPVVEETSTTTPEIIIPEIIITPEVATTIEATEATTTPDQTQPIIQQEISPAIEQNPPVIEQAPNPEEPTPPPPPEPTPEPNL